MVNSPEVRAMRRAISLACTPGVPLGPNPRVGAVVLSPLGEVIAEGLHRGAGTAHAEVAALTASAGRARGSTVVVSLEPCNHEGRTGPCATAVVDAGVRRVVFGQYDRSPLAGGGEGTLRAAGVDVEGGVLADHARQVNPEWTLAQARGRPFVTWKFATSVDGRSAAEDGSSQWITGPDARADVHRLRAECGAVLVGTGTVLADDPQLTVRPSGEPLEVDRQPLRAVMGLREIPLNARVLDSSAPSMTLRTRDPERALNTLADHGCCHVLLEGGPTLAAAFVRAGLVDRVIGYVSPTLIGGGAHVIADLGVRSLSQSAQLSLMDVTRLGNDIRLTMQWAAVPLKPESATPNVR